MSGLEEVAAFFSCFYNCSLCLLFSFFQLIYQHCTPQNDDEALLLEIEQMVSQKVCRLRSKVRSLQSIVGRRDEVIEQLEGQLNDERDRFEMQMKKQIEECQTKLVSECCSNLYISSIGLNAHHFTLIRPHFSLSRMDVTKRSSF